MSAVTIIVPLAVAAWFGLVGPIMARRLPPRHATWLLSVGGVAAALSALAVLGLLGFVLLAQVPDVASKGHWSMTTLRQHAPVEPGVGVGSLLAALAATTATLVVASRRGLAVLAAYRSCRGMPVSAGNLVVVTKAQGGAVAVPGRPGRIVVAQSLLAALSGPERRALLAHERAHLEHGHHWHVGAVSLAAAANPLLAPLRGAVAHATERWADEEAAEEVGDRRAVAAAVARAALVSGRLRRSAGPQLAAAAHAVPARVAALLIRPPRPQPALMFLTSALLLAGVAAAVVAGKETEHLFEFAGRAYRATHGG